jgi:hypothetical protein
MVLVTSMLLARCEPTNRRGFEAVCFSAIVSRAFLSRVEQWPSDCTEMVENTSTKISILREVLQ